MERNFKVGDKVWVYAPPCSPIPGVVSELLDYRVRVKTGNKVSPNSVHSSISLFARPAHKSRLIAEMEDDADLLVRLAQRFANEPCDICGGEEWVCESHPDKPWNESGCKCNAGMLCQCVANERTTSATAHGNEERRE